MKSYLSSLPSLKSATDMTKKSLILVSFLVICSGNQEIITDAWAGSTQVVAPPPPVNPTLRISNASPAIANNIINVVEGQSVSLCVSTSDPNGYNSLALTLNGTAAFQNETSFVASNCDSDQLVEQFTWHTQKGDAAKHPQTTLTFSAINTYYNPQPTTTSNIQIMVQDLLQPSFDPIAAKQTLTVGVPFTLPIVANSDGDADPVSITGKFLPANSTLSKAALATSGLHSGKWVAYFNWTPTEAEYEVFLTNPTYNVSFFAQDETVKTAAQAQPKQTDVSFALVPPIITDHVIKQLQVSLLTWNAAKGVLSAAGSVKFIQHYSVVKNLGILLTDANSGQAISAVIPVNDHGLWHVAQTLSAATIPCKITANVVHIQIDGSYVNATTSPVTHTVKQTPADITCQP